MEDLKQEIEKALSADVEMTMEDRREKNKKADLSTKAHGGKGKAAVIDEELRHKRIQSNFYGTQVNFNASILAELSEAANILRYIFIALQYILPPEKLQDLQKTVKGENDDRN